MPRSPSLAKGISSAANGAPLPGAWTLPLTDGLTIAANASAKPAKEKRDKIDNFNERIV